MSIDKSKLPPQLQDLLKTLESRGVNVEVIAGEMPPELRKILGLGTTTGGQKTSEPSSTDSPDGYPPFGEFLDKLAGVMAKTTKDISFELVNKLHDHLCPQVKKLTESDKRQQEINDSLFGELRRLSEQLSLTAQQCERQKGEILELSQIVADLREAHRKQVGLLHRRVTKRKGEIGAVAVAAAVDRSAGARKTRVRK